MKEKRILITGSGGFVGRNLIEHLRRHGYKNLVTVSATDYNLTEQEDVRRMFKEIRPEIVINLAAYVGGILANKERPADFFYKNIVMGTLVMHEAKEHGVEKFIALIGGCSYPAHAPSPIKEEDMWEGYPQPESAPYSLAKKMSIVQAQAYRQQFGFNAIVLVPGNLYGPHDNFSLKNSHVIPALIRKFYEAKKEGKDEVVSWGSGKPTRDFIYVGDAVEAIITALEDYNEPDIVNISSGTEVSIKDLVETIAELTQFKGKVVWDATKPDGQLYKGFAVERMRKKLGFEPKTDLRSGLAKTIEWFEKNYDKDTVRL